MTKDEAVQQVLNAWRVEGVSPNYHRQAQEMLRQQWPTLYWALVVLSEVAE